MFPSCFAIDQGTAVIHSAELGGGARIAVNCGDRADVYLHLCTVEYCNVAFNALKGSQLWLSDCRTRHVWHRSLAVHRGAVSCVTSPSVAVGGDGGGSVLSAPLELAGRCYINNVVVCPRWESEVNRHSTTPVLYAAPFSTSTEQQESLIRVTGGGVLVMKACLVLLNEEAHTLFQRHRGSEVALSMVFAEGRDTSVLLNCVLFHISPTMLSGNGADPCVGGIRSKMFDAYQFLVLRNGARGEVRNITDRDVLDDSRGDVGPYLFHLSGADSRLCGAFHVMPLPCPRKVDGTSVTARAAVNFDGSAAVPKGARNDAVLKGAERDTTTLHSSRTVPVRILVQGTSTLKLENVQLRWLTVSGASTVTATLCHFAGANAVHVSDSSTLEAEQSVLVSAVGGPAVRVHNSMLTLKGCTGYRLYREVIAAQCSVLRLVGTTMHTAVRLDSEVSYDFGPKQPEKLTTSATLHNKGTASEEEVNETQGSVSGPHGGSVPDTGMVTRSTSPVVRDHTCMAFLQCIHSRSHTHHTEDAHSDITCHPHIRSMPRPFGSEERRTCLCNPRMASARIKSASR
ncbi:hypothetical protein ERJ75_000848000 [Trypanosoma vivax]|nr:hypothetical protein ERJ75_000848000 [Trypanosoma vivax]